MKQLPRIVMVLGLLGMATLFLFPMWRITLIAPQYPDGINMYIHINRIGGDSPSTLQNVNILNHYIGMQKIEPESIAELRYFPKIVIGMIILGLVAVFVNKPWAYLSWGIVMGLLAVAGLYDFYLWEYDYGHNLADNAPMTFEGASFQPPLIGRKDIINFVAISMPHTAGYFAGFGMVMPFLAAWLCKRNGRAGALQTASLSLPILLGLMFSIGGCAPAAEPLNFGSDSCSFCRMTVIDQQRAAQVVNAHGKSYSFDAVECMINYVHANPDQEFPLQLVCTHDSPGVLSNATDATFFVSSELPSPMGANLTGFAERRNADQMQSEIGGEIFDYDGISRILSEK